jgi:amidase
MEELLLRGTATAISQAIAKKQVSAREVTGWYLGRIEAFNHAGPALNAVRELATNSLKQAEQADRELADGRPRGPLHGVPILVKDNILTADGMAATGGAAALKDFIPTQDAALVSRLRAAGAIVLGKTNLTEFADYVSDVMPSAFSSAGGEVKNPHTLQSYGRGLGSSVGSAAAVAARFAPLAIGSETQNSIQTPASDTSDQQPTSA